MLYGVAADTGTRATDGQAPQSGVPHVDAHEVIMPVDELVAELVPVEAVPVDAEPVVAAGSRSAVRSPRPSTCPQAGIEATTSVASHASPSVRLAEGRSSSC